MITEPNYRISYPDPCLVMVGGVPGAGKTTLIERAIPSNAILMSADAYRGRVQVLAGYSWDAYVPECIPAARDKFLSDLHVLLEHQVPVFLDASYLTKHSQDEMIAVARQYDTTYALLLIHATLEECIAGVSNRERTVPVHLIHKFYDDYLKLLDRIDMNWSNVDIVTRQASETLCIDVI